MACCPRSPGPTLLSLVLPTPCAQPERPECERPLAEGSLSPGGSNLPQQEPQLESLPTFKPSPLWKSLVSFHVTGEPRVAPKENPRLSQAETDRVWGSRGQGYEGVSSQDARHEWGRSPSCSSPAFFSTRQGPLSWHVSSETMSSLASQRSLLLFSLRLPLTAPSSGEG